MTQVTDLAQQTQFQARPRRHWSIWAVLVRLWPRRPRQPEPLPASLLQDLGLHAQHRVMPLPLHHTDPLLLRR